MDGVLQRSDTIYMVMTFLVLYLLFILVGIIVSTLFGLDLLTATTSVITCISNVGPGFGDVGSMNNFSSLPAVVKLLDAGLMLLGRLEIFGLIQLFLIKWWV